MYVRALDQRCVLCNELYQVLVMNLSTLRWHWWCITKIQLRVILRERSKSAEHDFTTHVKHRCSDSKVFWFSGNCYADDLHSPSSNLSRAITTRLRFFLFLVQKCRGQ